MKVANLITALLTLILLVAFYEIKKRFRPKSILLNSGPLIAIILGVIINSILDLTQYGVTTPEDLNVNYPKFIFPDFQWSDVNLIWMDAIKIGLICYAESSM